MKLIAMLMMAADPGVGQPLPDVVLLDFYAGYCQPCQQMVPVLQRMESNNFPIRKIDISAQPALSRQFKVKLLPTFVLLVEGREVKRFVGLTAEAELREAMNTAARELDEARKAARKKSGNTQSFVDTPSEANRKADANEGRMTAEDSGGIRGIFDRMKRGLSGDRGEVAPPDYRAQSPDENGEDSGGSLAMQSTIRVRILDGDTREFATGTIVHSSAGQSTILTCAHVFRGVSSKAALEVDVFRDGQVLKYPADVVGGNYETDLAFLTIQNAKPLPTSRIARQLSLQTNDPVFSIGCNNGDAPTRLNMNVAAINRFEGPENIVCTRDPVLGRSGGGLFNTSGELVGVCSGALRKEKEGLYSGVKPIQQLAEANQLGYLFQDAAPSFDSGSDNLTVSDPANPFAEDDALFDQLIAEPGSGFAESETEPGGSRLPVTAAADLANPFAPSVTSAPAAGTQQPAEITVIIDSKDPTKGKQVIVIPRPSPWLVELLSGETNVRGNSNAARGSTISTTSVRKDVSPERLHDTRLSGR